MGRISFPQGRGNQTHNRRDYEAIGRPTPQNIDQTRTKDNIILVDKDIRDAYKEVFGVALDEYNAKQKRKDRQINDYYDHIAKSKNGEKVFYEDVLQWGTKDDFNDPMTRKKAIESLFEYANTFQERNPNLRLIGAYIHLDEASPHLHIDYIPIAHGYKTGLGTRNALDRAMKEQGFKPTEEGRKNNATKLWKEREREYFAEICQQHGLKVAKERRARGSLSVEEYREAKREQLESIMIERDIIEEQTAYSKRLNRQLKEEITQQEQAREILHEQIVDESEELVRLRMQALKLEDQQAEIDNNEQIIKDQKQMIAENSATLEEGHKILERQSATIKEQNSILAKLQELRNKIEQDVKGFRVEFDAMTKRYTEMINNIEILQRGIEILNKQKQALEEYLEQAFPNGVRVPRSLLNELFKVRDREIPITRKLSDFIQRESDINSLKRKDRGEEREDRGF